MTTPMPALPLSLHPSTPCGLVRRCEVEISLDPRGRLSLVYTVEGELAALRIPDPSPSRRADGLWRHTCCEAFLKVPGGAGYYEFNFSPSTEWAVYGFTGYREGMAAVDAAKPPAIAVRRGPDRLELAAAVDLRALIPALAGSGLRLGLSAVVEAADGSLSYWALRHPPGRPDFHHPDGFAATLAPSENA
jgi:hypothetical protein